MINCHFSHKYNFLTHEKRRVYFENFTGSPESAPENPAQRKDRLIRDMLKKVQIESGLEDKGVELDDIFQTRTKENRFSRLKGWRPEKDTSETLHSIAFNPNLKKHPRKENTYVGRKQSEQGHIYFFMELNPDTKNFDVYEVSRRGKRKTQDNRETEPQQTLTPRIHPDLLKAGITEEDILSDGEVHPSLRRGQVNRNTFFGDKEGVFFLADYDPKRRELVVKPDPRFGAVNPMKNARRGGSETLYSPKEEREKEQENNRKQWKKIVNDTRDNNNRAEGERSEIAQGYSNKLVNADKTLQFGRRSLVLTSKENGRLKITSPFRFKGEGAKELQKALARSYEGGITLPDIFTLNDDGTIAVQNSVTIYQNKDSEDLNFHKPGMQDSQGNSISIPNGARQFEIKITEKNPFFPRVFRSKKAKNRKNKKIQIIQLKEK